jgi:hypothetical protein
MSFFKLQKERSQNTTEETIQLLRIRYQKSMILQIKKLKLFPNPQQRNVPVFIREATKED